MPVLAYASDDFVTANAQDSVADVRAALAEAGRSEAFLVDADGRFAGVWRIAGDVGTVPVRDAARPPAVRFDETTTVVDAMHLLCGFVGDAVPVVHSRTARLLGVVPEAAIIEAYLDTSRSLREEENAAL